MLLKNIRGQHGKLFIKCKYKNKFETRTNSNQLSGQIKIKKANWLHLIKKFNLKQFSIKIQRLDRKYERSLLRKLYPNLYPEQKPTSIESSCAICLETLLEVNLIFLNLLNKLLIITLFKQLTSQETRMMATFCGHIFCKDCFDRHIKIQNGMSQVPKYLKTIIPNF